MGDAWLIVKDQSRSLQSTTKLFFEGTPAKVLANKISWEIISSLEKGPKYAREIAKERSLNEQSVYYHVKKLLECGIIKVVEERSIRGASAKRLSLSGDGVSILFRKPSKEVLKPYTSNDKLCLFFKDFVKGDAFDGYIVVGSPEPHGPFRAVARDGHYAAQLSYYLGKCFGYPTNFFVRLDTDIKAEKLYDENLVLIGGPITNLLVSELNQYLKVKFIEPNYWSGIIDNEGNVFSGETDALITKIRNPFDRRKCVIAVAGVRHQGTKSAIIGMTECAEDVLKSYSGQTNYALIIKGFDQDGDGKVDHTEVLRTYSY
ncbi:MAG: helix-turn-helix domain-containing protein [Nitrososphaeria archaeon]